MKKKEFLASKVEKGAGVAFTEASVCVPIPLGRFES